MTDSSSNSDNELSPVIHKEAKRAARRGLTTMRKLDRTKQSGERLVIEYNNQGQAIGESATKMQSFIGVCVRQQIPLTYNNWVAVPKELKENIFHCVETSFVVDPRSKRAVFQSAAKKFRSFRYSLKQNYILPFKEEPSLLQTPPEKYSHIDQEQWETFVNARLSEEWETLSRVQSERRGKCMYNHHISRKGYANLAQELEVSDDPSNRAVLWKEARKRKNNEYFDDATRECANRIDELAAARQGEDILSEALGTPEHRGRVRGVGDYVKPSLYFNVVTGKANMGVEPQNKRKTRASKPKKSTSKKSNVSKTKSKVEETKKSTSEKNIVLKTKSKGKEVVDELDNLLEGIPCSLAIGSVDNIVALGSWFEYDVLFPTIHGVPLGANNVRVVVDMLVGEDVPIPIPVIGEIETLSQAKGSFVAWPREFVILNKEKKVPSPTKPKTDVHITQSSNHITQSSNHITESSNHITQSSNHITQSSNHTDRHVTIKLLNRYAVLSMQVEDTIQINLSENIFGKEKTIFLHRDDIMQYCGMVEIGYSCILTYIAYLWSVCDKEIISKFMIVDQATISSSVKCKETRCKNLANRLDTVNLDQLVLIPHNTGHRWKLIVIHPRENIVYILSSFRKTIKESFQGIVNTSLRMWQAKHSLPQYRSIITWKRIKCPRQLSSVECGYYVQKYIREIVHNSSTSISNIFEGKTAYKQEEIDEVRLEWATFVGRFV